MMYNKLKHQKENYMTKDNEHIFLTETESAEGNFNFKIEAGDLLFDLKVLLKEYYIATFTDDGKSLLINFNNGQKFKLSLEEIK